MAGRHRRYCLDTLPVEPGAVVVVGLVAVLICFLAAYPASCSGDRSGGGAAL